MQKSTNELPYPWTDNRSPHLIYAAGEHKIYDTTLDDGYYLPGYLCCDKCGDHGTTRPPVPAWCEHMAQVVLQGIDGLHLNGALDPSYCQLPGMTMVPIKPTLGVWAQVHVEAATTAHVGRKAWLITRVDPAQRIDLGYLYPGEGRNVLRIAIFDWLRSVWAGQHNEGMSISCLNTDRPGHSFEFTPNWKVPPEPFEDQLASLFLIYGGKPCLDCVTRAGHYNPDDSIPDV